MLQQILQDLYVDPELLAELDEEQKQILFVKMREEQVRRWKEKEAEHDRENQNKPKTPKKSAKKVDFLLGKDGCEWVWVMGEHKDDLTIEQILEREAQEKARIQAEKEAQELREKEEKDELELKKKIEAEKRRLEEENARLEREMKEKKEAAAKRAEPDEKAREEIVKIQEIKRRFEEQEKKRIAELQEEQKVLRRRSRLLVDDVRNRRSSEIYVQWKETRQKLEKQAEESSKVVEESWKAQEEKAKEAEQEMREVAQRARLEYRESLKRSNNMIRAVKAFEGSKTAPDNKPPVPPKKHLMNSPAAKPAGTSKPRPLRPRSKNMVIDWFVKEEKDKGAGMDPKTGKVAEWFHGIISRSEAESLLKGQGTGAYLVRVSERVWGYTISYNEDGRCKHFLIDSTDLGYQFFGVSQVSHKSLADLVEFHKKTPITVSGNERLIKPVGQVSDPPDYCDLFQSNKTESTAL